MVVIFCQIPVQVIIQEGAGRLGPLPVGTLDGWDPVGRLGPWGTGQLGPKNWSVGTLSIFHKVGIWGFQSDAQLRYFADYQNCCRRKVCITTLGGDAVKPADIDWFLAHQG